LDWRRSVGAQRRRSTGRGVLSLQNASRLWSVAMLAGDALRARRLTLAITWPQIASPNRD